MGSGAPDGAGVLPMLHAYQERKPTRKEGTREREREKRKKGSDKPTSPQAHKERDTPPYCKGQAAVPLITNSRQKIRKKSLGVVMKKFSEKFFVGMFRGKKNPLRYLNGRGVVTNSIKL